MSNTVIKVENLSKQYRLGLVGTGTLSHDLKRWWHVVRGKEDPYLKVGEVNDRAVAGGEYVWALKDINFEVKQGEVLGIIGKNGAGKSTLLKILSQVTGPTTGSVKAKGRIASLLEVGTGFHPELTGRENIFLNGAILGMTRGEIKEKLDEIVEFAGVAKYIDTPTKRYSSGMMVRLGFAVAAHLEPEILVVDEVLAVGDAEFQKKCIGKMKDVAGGGRTVLFVSHNMESVEMLCNRCLLIENGSIRMNDRTDKVVQSYINSVANVMKTTPIGDRKDRQGNGSYMYDEVMFTNANGEKTTMAKPGESICINLKVKKKDPGALPVKALCSIGVHDARGKRLFTLSNVLLGRKIVLEEDQSTISWKIDEVQLYPGEYKCNIFLAEGDTSGVIDWVIDAFYLNVAPTDYYSTGQVVKNQSDVFFVKHDVSLTKDVVSQ